MSFLPIGGRGSSEGYWNRRSGGARNGASRACTPRSRETTASRSALSTGRDFRRWSETSACCACCIESGSGSGSRAGRPSSRSSPPIAQGEGCRARREPSRRRQEIRDDEEHEQGEERGGDEVERSPRRWTQVSLEDMTDEQDHDEDDGDPRDKTRDARCNRGHTVGWNRRRVIEFITTETELKPIAAPAMIGFRTIPTPASTPAAIGMRAVL